MSEAWNELPSEEQWKRIKEGRNDNAGRLPPVDQTKLDKPSLITSGHNEESLEVIGLVEFLIQPRLNPLITTYVYLPAKNDCLDIEHIKSFAISYKNRFNVQVPQNIMQNLQRMVSDENFCAIILRRLERNNDLIISNQRV